MEFVTLGTAGGPVPLKHRAQPAHAVISGERTILVDCGDGAMGQLMKAGIDFRHVNEIIISHHHFDHIGGNKELKQKYNSIVVGYKNDSKRIPEISVLVEDNQIWKADNFEAKIIHIPGHTTGHIGFYFFNEKAIFTGDTLFSLGCGKIFEGTYEEMFESLSKIKNLPNDTKIYCGHEYTLQNSNFCIKHDPQNLNLQNKITSIKEKLDNNTPTIPSTLKDEKECNIFLRAKNVDSFSKLRDLKDNF